MADVNDILQDPKFWEYSDATKMQILDRVDERFKALEPTAKKIALSRMTPKSNVPRMPQDRSEDPLRTFTQTMGGIAGGGAAALATGALTKSPALTGTAAMAGRAAGSAVGVEVGTAIGDMAYQFGQWAAGTPKAPESWSKAMKDAAAAGLDDSAIEFASQFVTFGGSKVLAPFARKLMPEVQKVRKWLDTTLPELKPSLLPAESSEARTLKVLNNISEYSIFGGDTLASFRQNRAKVLEDMADDILRSYGRNMTATDAGELFMDAIDKRNKVFKLLANKMYETADERIMLRSAIGVPPTVSTQNIKSMAGKWQEVMQELKGIEAEHAGEPLVKAITGLDDDLSLPAARELRSRLIAKVDEFQVLNKNAPAFGKAKALLKQLDADIRDSVPADAKQYLDSANQFYKEGSEKFNSVFIRKLLKKGETDPQLIASAIFDSKSPSRIQRVKNALTTREWEKMQGYEVNNLFAKAGNLTDDELRGIGGAAGNTKDLGVMSGRKLLNVMYGRGGIGKDALEEIYNPAQLESLTNFAKALTVSQAKQAEGLGRMWVQLAQGTAILQLASVGAGAAGMIPDYDPTYGLGGSVVLFGPMVLSKMMTKPSMVRWLTEGIKLPAGSSEVVGITMRLLNGAREVNSELLEERRAEGMSEGFPRREQETMEDRMQNTGP